MFVESEQGETMTLPERFTSKFEVDDETGCWLWTAGRSSGTGYANYWHDGKTRSAHRFAYIETYGEPDEETLHHRCETRHCVNPDHLEPVSHRENLLASDETVASQNASRTHCPQGHALVEGNLKSDPRYPNARGSCKTCDRTRARNRQRRLRASSA